MAPHSQVVLWEKATARLLVPMRITARGGSILGVIGGRELAGASFCRLSATPHAAIRDERLAGGPGAGHYKVAIGLAGRSVVTQHGRRVSLAPGDLTVYDTSEPYGVSGEVPFGLLVVRIPQGALGVSRDRLAAVAATALPADGVVAVRRGLLDLATGSRPAGGLDEVLASLSVLVRRSPSARRPGPRNADAILAAAMEIVADRLDDADLGPGYLAAALGVSRRYLYGLFAAEVGPIAQYVRVQRLERARALLGRSAPDELSVAEVAVQCGFTDQAHFSRLFRRAYGHPPSRCRRGGGGGSSPAAPPGSRVGTAARRGPRRHL